MRRSSTRGWSAALAVALLVASGCAMQRTEPTPKLALASDPGVSKLASASDKRTSELGRAELWSAYCGRCHNLRPQSEYSPAQWAVIVNHMRTIGDLPGEDYRRLLEYLGDRRMVPKARPMPTIAIRADTSRVAKRAP